MFAPQLVDRPVRSADESPIFVIGTGRSGTTLLRQMLDAHPRIHITHEAAVYFYRSLAPADATVAEWLPRYLDTLSYAWLRLDPRALVAELPRGVAGARDDDVVRALLRAKARARGKARCGEKNPLDTLSLARIFAEFRDPRVVHIVRDYRATVTSLGRMPWSTDSVVLNSLFCRVQYRQVTPYLDRVLEVRLEDLISRPRDTLQSILRFVGEPWDDAVLDHPAHASTDDVAPLPWFATATDRPLDPRAVDRDVTRGLAPAAVRIVERINRAAMARYGYAPAPLEREPDARAIARQVQGELGTMARVAQRVVAYQRRVRQHMRGEARFDPQLALEATLAFNPAARRRDPSLVIPTVPAVAKLT